MSGKQREPMSLGRLRRLAVPLPDEAELHGSLVEIATIAVARQVLLFGLDQVEWEDFPDIGEHDWDRVMARAKDLANAPEYVEFVKAYALLKERAEGGDHG